MFQSLLGPLVQIPYCECFRYPRTSWADRSNLCYQGLRFKAIKGQNIPFRLGLNKCIEEKETYLNLSCEAQLRPNSLRFPVSVLCPLPDRFLAHCCHSQDFSRILSTIRPNSQYNSQCNFAQQIPDSSRILGLKSVRLRAPAPPPLV